MANEKPSELMTETPAAAEGYTVLARRYRPQRFADIIGQEPVARALANALKSNRVAHAYLFTGARGVGKTSTARILAKALNCEKGPTATPCGECDICTNIATGEDVDVLEIDGASNRRIDEIRDIRSNVQYRPSRARYKIYIIDEVHMLTKEAFNALLKTLEEPPPHVKFIFATTEVEKVPITILSRCQRFDFAGIPVPRIVEHLRGIVEREKMQADEEALELVARRAGGSMRDAQSLLDQLLAFGGERLTVDQVHALLGTAGDERIVALVEAVLAHEVKQALDLLDEAVVSGRQLGELLDQMIAYWRDLMVVHCAGTEGRDLSVPSRHRAVLLRQAQALNVDAILAALDILSAAKSQLKNSNHGRTLVEMALVRLGRLENLVALPYLVRLIQQRGGTAVTAAVPTVAPPEGAKKKFPDSAPENGAGEYQPLTAENLPEIWAKTLRKVPGLLARSLAKGETPAIIAPNNLVLRFPIDYNGAKELVEAALQELTGQPWTLRVESATEAASALDAAPLGEDFRRRDEAGDSKSPNSPGVVGPRRNPREEAEKLPLVKRAIDVLGASFQRVDEGFGVLPNAGTNADEIPVEDES
ncbi:MAG TPA: DNA polymerase III subunit gamma/tau [Gemmataceae bacterium]|nr:DNA polymerase III subunit gamma/tau [Gemmataceae bacterium]